MSAPKTWEGALNSVRNTPLANQNDGSLCRLVAKSRYPENVSSLPQPVASYSDHP